MPARGGRHVTSPPPRLAFLDPAAASPLLRLPPALPSMSRLGSFLSLPPPPLPLVLFPPPPESGSAPTCRPPPRSLSRPRFLYPAGGVGTVAFCGLLGSTKKRERKKNELSIWLRPAVSLSLAGSLKRFIRVFLVCGQARLRNSSLSFWEFRITSRREALLNCDDFDVGVSIGLSGLILFSRRGSRGKDDRQLSLLVLVES